MCCRFWVFACVPNPGKQSIWRQCPPSARKQSTKKLPNRPGFAHVQGPLPELYEQSPQRFLCPYRILLPVPTLLSVVSAGSIHHFRHSTDLLPTFWLKISFLAQFYSRNGPKKCWCNFLHFLFPSAPLCWKNTCCVSCFCPGGGGAAGSKCKPMSKGP